MLARILDVKTVTSTSSRVVSSVSADGVRMVAMTFHPFAAKELHCRFTNAEDVLNENGLLHRLIPFPVFNIVWSVVVRERLC